MANFVPKLVAQPSLSPTSELSEDAKSVFRGTWQVSRKLGYNYTATHHLLYALLEYSYTDPGKIFIGLDLPIFEIRRAMLRIDPPRHIDIPPAFRTTEAICNCYQWAAANKAPQSLKATPLDIYAGFLRHREATVDAILAEMGVRITENFLID
jgi:hypothetical protein